MTVNPHPDKVTVFPAESIKAMGPAAQGIAKLLSDAGWIQIKESKPEKP
jgi:hypothetical protein